MNEIDWTKPVECKAIRGDWWPVVQRCESSTGEVAFVVECPDDGSLRFWHRIGPEVRNVRRKVKHERCVTFKKTGEVGVHEFDPREAENNRFMIDVVDVRWFHWEAEVDE